eukprot:CAMPEP_0117487594 /NCGR_PEP_ID=MMETSP0784-20121206/16076_1 /TAXON_ID=39447 /ORGANISM="" /LENGTH=555 /DNA_ID=CAMNT_0005282247 /DNA_START=1 /DNA_END=1668 /DNA_ORIENTATION=-
MTTHLISGAPGARKSAEVDFDVEGTEVPRVKISCGDDADPSMYLKSDSVLWMYTGHTCSCCGLRERKLLCNSGDFDAAKDDFYGKYDTLRAVEAGEDGRGVARIELQLRNRDRVTHKRPCSADDAIKDFQSFIERLQAAAGLEVFRETCRKVHRPRKASSPSEILVETDFAAAAVEADRLMEELIQEEQQIAARRRRKRGNKSRITRKCGLGSDSPIPFVPEFPVADASSAGAVEVEHVSPADLDEPDTTPPQDCASHEGPPCVDPHAEQMLAQCEVAVPDADAAVADVLVEVSTEVNVEHEEAVDATRNVVSGRRCAQDHPTSGGTEDCERQQPAVFDEMQRDSNSAEATDENAEWRIVSCNGRAGKSRRSVPSTPHIIAKSSRDIAIQCDDIDTITSSSHDIAIQCNSIGGLSCALESESNYAAHYFHRAHEARVVPVDSIGEYALTDADPATPLFLFPRLQRARTCMPFRQDEPAKVRGLFRSNLEIGNKFSGALPLGDGLNADHDSGLFWSSLQIGNKFSGALPLGDGLNVDHDMSDGSTMCCNDCCLNCD